jgi:mycothiol system anti-sigma-R factor
VVDSENDSDECARVVTETWTFLDGECSAETYTRVCQHLSACESCVDHYALAGRFKIVIATKCGGDRAPDRSGW